ncbi:MAG: Gfo/Idh/MocA family oxidoreductase [bacterium]|nr:Gfo/Idh/MocA family oxidoreductase [bacterium]
MSNSARRYRAAVIGCGWIGLKASEDPLRAKPASHAEAFRSSSRTKLAGLADINKKSLELAGRLYPKVPRFASAAEMLREIRPEIVSIATPPETHALLVGLAARLGVKVIICEKPISHDLKAARRALKIVKKFRSILLVNHKRRFDPVLQKYRELALRASGKTALGKIRLATAYYDKGVFHTATHIIDLLRFFLGEVKWVSAIENKNFLVPPDDFNVDAYLGFKSGVVAALQNSERRDYTLGEVTFFGQKGKLVLRSDWGLEIEGRGLRASPYFSRERELDYKKTLFSEGSERSFFPLLVKNAVACLERKARPGASGEDAVKDLEIMLALKKSAKLSGKKVFL